MIEGKFCEKRNRCCPTGFWLFPTKYATLEQKKKRSRKSLCVVSFVRKTCLDHLQVAFVFPF